MKENKLTLRQWFNKESVAGSICTLPFVVFYAGSHMHVSLLFFD